MVRSLCYDRKGIGFYGYAGGEVSIDVEIGGTGGTGGTWPHFSQSIRQSAPLQLKKMPVFVYEGTPEYMCPTPTF